MDTKNLRLVGTSHIARQSLKEVKATIIHWKPHIIALELDRKRLFALTSKKRQKGFFSISNIKRIGLKGFLFSLIGEFAQKRLGRMVGVAPGSEMRTAIRLAKKQGIALALVDRDIEITLKRFSKSLTWTEKKNFVVDVVKGLISRKEFDFDLRTVPEKELIKKLIREMKKRYPNVYKVLVKERNEYMAGKLAHIIANNPDKRVLAIIGAGHEEAIMMRVVSHLKKYKFQ
jgi:pheromone shutdown-related protein TraB